MSEQAESVQAQPAIQAAPEPVKAPEKPTNPSSDPEWLNPRLEQAKRGASSEILKRLGADSVEALETQLAELKQIKAAQLTEAERVALKIQELEPRAARAIELEETIGTLAKRELGALTESQRAAVETLAGSDPSKQIRAIEALRHTWAAAPVAPAAPASTSAAPAAPASLQTSNIDHKQRFQELQKTNPFEASRYAQKHARELLQ